MQKCLGIRIPSGAFWAAEGGEESGDGRGGCGGGCWYRRQRVGPIIIGPFPSGDEGRRRRDGWEKLQRRIGRCKALDLRTAAAGWTAIRR